MASNMITVLYYILVSVCVTISAYLSYFGYYSSFNWLSMPFTLVIAMGLFGADTLIQRSRVNGQSIIAPILLFFLFSTFSSISNFNYLYTNFMEEDVVKHTLDGQYSRFRNSLISTRSQLTDLDAFVFTEKQRVELERELARLRTQINDQLRPGCGKRCKEHLASIEQILGKSLTDLALPPPGANDRIVNDWYDRVREAALTDFEELIKTNEFPELTGLLEYVDKLLLEYDTPDRVLARGESLPILRKIAEESQEIERRANSLISNNKTVKHEEIDVTLGRLGEIVYSLEHGFIERPDLGATIMSSVLSIVIDAFPVIFALVAFRPSSGGRIRALGERKGRAGIVLD